VNTLRTLTAAIYRQEDRYTAHCLEVDLATHGSTVDEAMRRLPEAVLHHLRVLADPERELSRTPAICSFAALAFRAFHLPGIL
jgi:predicted RNase H-like HicB family nuclease